MFSKISTNFLAIVTACVALMLSFPLLHEQIHEIERHETPKLEQKQSFVRTPHNAFAQVLRSTYATPTGCIDKTKPCAIENRPVIQRSIGSSVILGSISGISYILTAQHVCEHRKTDMLIVSGVPYEYSYEEKVSVVTFEGEIADAIVVASDYDLDLCLMISPVKASGIVSIKAEEIEIGDDVQNVAAPVGVFSPGMALTFQGINSGIDKAGNSYFSFPGAPGSSGSPVFDKDGMLVSIIHSAHLHFSHFSIGVSQTNMIAFLYKHREHISFLGYFSDLPE